MPHKNDADPPASGTVTIAKRFVNKLVPPAKGEPRRTLWDAQLKGFGVRAYASGAIVYILQFRMRAADAKTRTYTIGKHGSPWTPDAARERARDLLEGVRRGVDPIAAERAAAATAGAVAAVDEAAEERLRLYDFDAFADRYVALHVVANALRKTSDVEGTFDRDLRPFFQGKCVLDLTTQDVKDMRAHVGQRSHSAANKAHKWLNAAFMWGIEHDGLTSSPMRDLTRPFPEGRRDRHLVDWELALVWSVLPGLAWQFAMLLRLLILTGQRLREVAGMRWEEIDLAKGEWIIPGARTKNKRNHMVPISPQMHRLLVAIEPDPDRRRGLLLTTTGRTPISGFSDMKEEVDLLVAAAIGERPWRRHGDAVAHWVVHDLRRTLSTGCGEMKVPLEHAEAVLNHVSGTLGGVAGVYWLYKYADEKKAALRKWGTRVERALSQHGVPFHPASTGADK